MNTIARFLIALLAITVLGCQSPVCLSLRGGATLCFSDNKAMHWVRNADSIGYIRLDSLPKHLAAYPQYDTMVVLKGGNYEVDTAGGLLVVTNSQGDVVASANPGTGFLMQSAGTRVMVAVAGSDGCVNVPIIPTKAGWQVGDSILGPAISLETTLHASGEGSAMYQSEAFPNTPGGRYKGTTVVLVDNFKAISSDKPCCAEGALWCCESGGVNEEVGMGVGSSNQGEGANLSSTLQMSYPDWYAGLPHFAELASMNPASSCLTMTCQYLRVGSCATGEISCYSTLDCQVDVWMSDDRSLATITTGTCETKPGFQQTCSSPVANIN